MQEHLQEQKPPSFIRRLIGTKNGRLGLAGGIGVCALAGVFLGPAVGLLILLAAIAGVVAAYKLNSKRKMAEAPNAATRPEPAKRRGLSIPGLSIPGLSKGQKTAVPTGPQPYDPQAFTPTPPPVEPLQQAAYADPAPFAAMQQGYGQMPQAYTPTQQTLAHQTPAQQAPAQHYDPHHHDYGMPQHPVPQQPPYMPQEQMQQPYAHPPQQAQAYEQLPATPPVMQAEPDIYQHVSGQPPQPYVPPTPPSAQPLQAAHSEVPQQIEPQPQNYSPQLFIPANPTAA